MFDRILTPTDGSEAAQSVAEIGIELAAITGADLYVLYVLKTKFPLEGHSVELEEKQQQEATDVVEEIAEEAHAHDLDTVTEIRQGVPYRQILSYADAQDINLIVMGTHGRTGLDRYLIGSTTEKVVRLSNAQVLTAHPFQNEFDISDIHQFSDDYE